MNATVLNDKNWIKTVNRDQLLGIAAVSQGPRHNPVNHGEMLDRFSERADHAGIQITAEKGLLSPNGQRFMYVADVAYDINDADYNFTVGFVNFNDRSRSFTGLAGQRVMVCSNECVTGILEESKTRHSTNVDNRLDAKMDSIFGQFKQVCDVQIGNVDRMKAAQLTDSLLGQFILNVTRSDFMGAANVRRVIEECDRPTLNNHDDNSMWRLHNAATYVIRENVKNPLQIATSTKILNDEIVKLVS